jgi:putative iron-only hydrogenase system regulator
MVAEMRRIMENRVSVISIIIEDADAAPRVNDLLHENRNYVIGRMGIPYKERGVSIISVVMDAPGTVTSALSGKLGMIKGVTTKTLTAKLKD